MNKKLTNYFGNEIHSLSKIEEFNITMYTDPFSLARFNLESIMDYTLLVCASLLFFCFFVFLLIGIEALNKQKIRLRILREREENDEEKTKERLEKDMWMDAKALGLITLETTFEEFKEKEEYAYLLLPYIPKQHWQT